MCAQSPRVFKNQNGMQPHNGQNLRQMPFPAHWCRCLRYLGWLLCLQKSATCAHLSCANISLLYQDCVKILSARCFVAAKGTNRQFFTWTWQSAFCTGESWDFPTLTGISAVGCFRDLPCTGMKQRAFTPMSIHA